MEARHQVTSFVGGFKLEFFSDKHRKVILSQITLTVNKVEHTFSSGISAGEVVTQINEKALPHTLGVLVGDTLYDLQQTITSSGALQLVSANSDEGLELIRHSTAHLMAMAIVQLFPDTKLAIGPTIENGFYYDFESSHKFTPDDFESIEKKMLELAKSNLSIQRKELNKQEALEYYQKLGETYKVLLIEDLKDDVISIYEQGDWSDLCRGPHVPSTKVLGHFKLLSVAGAYWRGDEKNAMLQRIYATAFANKKDLKKHLNLLEEAKKRDHRLLGKQMDLFSFQEEGPGFPFWHAKGMVLYNRVVDYWREIHKEHGYEEIKTPIMLNEQLWHTSGHWDNYKENMYFSQIDDHPFALKPMNCPGGVLVYKNKLRSYRELPLRMGELGLVHRHEKSGVLHGLFRVRMFTQDDAHIYCLEEQIEDEVIGIIRLVQKIYSDFGFNDLHIELSTRPKKSIGSDEIWKKAENSLEKALNKMDIEFKLNPEDGAFYGPKIDFHIKDSLGRSWQCGTIQLDFALPERFDATYMGEDGQKHRPIMLHRAILGSLERFIGILLESYGGDLPLWLNPQPIQIIPISEKFTDYCFEVSKKLSACGLSFEVDTRNEKMGKKIREGEQNKVPYLIIVGEKEIETGTLSLRQRKIGDLGTFSVDDLIKKFKLEVANKGN